MYVKFMLRKCKGDVAISMISGVYRPISGAIRKRLFLAVIWAISIALPALLIVRVGMQFFTPPPADRLLMVRDIPLPDAFPDPARTAQNPFAPGVARLFDHFDFQVVDPQTHLLFIAHTGPNPDREHQVNPHFDPDTGAKNDGNIIVFDTQQQKIVNLLPIPQVTGLTLDTDRHHVFAADSNDNIIYDINEKTMRISPITLQENDSPNGLAYDQIDHLLLIADPGSPANPDETNAIERKNQNVTFIDVRTDKVVGRVVLGIDGKWGDDVGHVRFDPQLHRVFVAVQQLSDPDSTNPHLQSPASAAWLVSIDPLTMKVVQRLHLPDGCIRPHGLVVDPTAHIGFLACVDVDPATLIRIDLQTMAVIQEKPWIVEAKPDMLAFDRTLHLLYVASASGITVFQQNGRAFKWLGSYSFGVNTHTLAVNEQTHELYLPLASMGGRPVLRIMRYNFEQYHD
jgi:hypothetical protein